MNIKNDTTERGFRITKFADLCGAECSIQKSSLASDYAIWIGITEAKPIIIGKAVRNDLVGWVKYPIPKNVQIPTRMHLNRDQVKALLPILQRFVKTGDI